MDSNILSQLNDIKTEYATKKIVQDQEKKKSGKYKQILRTKDENNIDYSVTEYLCPNGDVGFDIIFYATIDGKKFIKRACFGNESINRQHDWQEVINLI